MTDLNTRSETAIEWADKTWNPVRGCVKVSPGCKHCYAERIAKRWWRGDLKEAFRPRVFEDRFDYPRRWKKSSIIFTCSMSDLFQEHVDPKTIHRIFDTMEHCDWHLFLVLTKRSKRMFDFMVDRYGHDAAKTPRNIWCGVSIENNDYIRRADHLSITPAAKRFISFEPLLGKVDMFYTDWFRNVDWIIVGGESGPNARPMEAEWVEHLRRLILHGNDEWRMRGTLEGWMEPKYKTKFFFKQWGGKRAKSGGRLLDGREWNEMPELPASVIAAREAEAEKRRKKEAGGKTDGRLLPLLDCDK